MLAELDEKHKKDTEDKEKNKRHVLLELEREKTKKLK